MLTNMFSQSQTHTHTLQSYRVAPEIRVEMQWVEAHFDGEDWDTSGENIK